MKGKGKCEGAFCICTCAVKGGGGVRGHLLHLSSVPPCKLLFKAHVSEAQPQGVLLSRGASQPAYALRNSSRRLTVML